MELGAVEDGARGGEGGARDDGGRSLGSRGRREERAPDLGRGRRDGEAELGREEAPHGAARMDFSGRSLGARPHGAVGPVLTMGRARPAFLRVGARGESSPAGDPRGPEG